MRSSSVCAMHSRDRVCIWKDGSGCVAQLVEQLTLNQWVQGSSPCASTRNKRPFVWPFFLCWTKRTRARERVRNASWQEQANALFAPYVVKGTHGVKTNMGIYSPKQSPPEINGHFTAVFCLILWTLYPRDSYLCKYLYCLDRIWVLT